MADAARHLLRRHTAPALVLAAICLALNLLGLQDFEPRLAVFPDDHSAYYARRAVDRVHYAGDLFHNEMQREYVTLSAPHWISALLYGYLNFDPVGPVWLLTAAKAWLMAFAVYALAYGYTGRRAASILAAAGALSSYVTALNLASFAFWLHMPYQSDLAYPLILFAFVALRYRQVGVALGIIVATVALHPSLGLMGYFLVLVGLLADRSSYTRRTLTLTLLVALPIASVAVLPAAYVLRQIPVEELGSARAIYDALNETHGALWELPANNWWPRALGTGKLLLFLVPVFLSRRTLRPDARRPLTSALGGTLVLIALGLLAKAACMALYDTPFLALAVRFHQLLMTRASALTVLIAFAVTAVYLTRRLGPDGSVPARLAAGLSLLVLADVNGVYGLTVASWLSVILTLAPVVVLTWEEVAGERGGRIVRIATAGVMLLGFALLARPLIADPPVISTVYRTALIAAVVAVPLLVVPRLPGRLALPVVAAFAVAVSLDEAARNALPPRHFAHDWLAAARWARDHTDEGTSFLRLTDVPGHAAPEGWRTFAHRGVVKLFSPPWSMVYTPDLRYDKYLDPITHYLRSKHPDHAGRAVLMHLDAADLAWLRDTSGARYAIAPRSLRVGYTPLYKNASVAIYDLAAPLAASQNWALTDHGAKVVGGGPFCPPPNDAGMLLRPRPGNLPEGYAAALPGPLPQMLDLDLSTPRRIRTFRLEGYDVDNRPLAFALLGRNDQAATWEPIAAWVDNAEADVEASLPRTVMYRYVRLRIDQSAGQGRLLLRALELYGD